MQSSLLIRRDHVAAVMAADDLPHLPALVEAGRDLGAGLLTVCTLPPDLRLASMHDAVALVRALSSTAGKLDCPTTLLGRRFYLPEDVVAGLTISPRRGVQLRLAVDYACRPSLMCGAPAASLLLLPRGLEPGNLLRWQFARARSFEVDWEHFDASTLSSFFDNRRAILPRLIAAR